MGSVTRKTVELTMPIEQDVFDTICNRIADGESLKAICRDEGMPTKTSFLRAVDADKARSDQYARAREAQGDADADAIGDIAARVLSGEYDPAAARVAIDALKWSAGKRLPKKYGDKLDLNHGGGFTVNLAGHDADL